MASTQTDTHDETLDATISALQGGLTSIDSNTAVSVISNWSKTLSGAGLTDISSDLDALKGELTSGSLSGARIGPILSRLGSKTTSAAASAPANYQSKLEKLGKVLSQAGGQLGG